MQAISLRISCLRDDITLEWFGMVLKRQMLAIQDVYVPVKRRQTLDPQKVEALAESIMEEGAAGAHSRAT